MLTKVNFLELAGLDKQKNIIEFIDIFCRNSFET